MCQVSSVADPHGEAAGPAAGRPRLQPPLPLVSPRDRGHRHAAQGAGPRQLRLQVLRLNRDIIMVFFFFPSVLVMDDCDLGEAAVVELVTKLVAGVSAGGRSSGAIGRIVLLL